MCLAKKEMQEQEVYIYDALNECDYVKNNLIISEPNLEDIYERVSFVISSIKCAEKEIRQMQNLINADEF